MSREGERNARNIVTLREYVEALIRQQKESHEREHEMLQANITLASGALEKHLVVLNGHQEHLAAERGSLLSKEAFEIRHEVLKKQIVGLEIELRNRISENEKAINTSRVEIMTVIKTMSIAGAILLFVLGIVEVALRFWK